MNRVRFAAFLLCLVLAPVTGLHAGDPAFGEFVKNLERDFNIRRTHIPMFWLAKGIVRIASPTGVSRLDLAIFEDQNFDRLAQAGDLKRRLDGMLGEGWRPFVEVDSRAAGERTFLYMRPRGRDVELMVFTMERNEAVAVLLRLNPDTLARAMDDPHSFAMSINSQ